MKPSHEKSKEKDPKTLHNKLAQLDGTEKDWAKIENDYPEMKTEMLTVFSPATLWARTNFILVRPNKPDENGRWHPFDKYRKMIKLSKIYIGDHKNIYIIMQYWNPEHSNHKISLHFIESYHDIKELLRQYPSRPVTAFLKEIKP